MSEKTTARNPKRRELSLSTLIVVAAVIAAVAYIAGTRNLLAFVAPTSGSGPSQLDFSSLNELYGVLRANYDGTLDTAKLIDGAKHGLIDAAGDPYTVYLNAEESKAFDSDLNGTFEGIGAELSKVDGQLTIMSIVADSPAKAAGLQARDIIFKINGEDTSKLTVGEAVKRIRGEKGTSIKLSILRDDTTNDYDITRNTISTPSVVFEVLEGGVGYLRLSRFGDDTAGLARKYANELKAQGVTKVLLDLRGNGGGLLTAAQDVASLWLEDKVIVSERRNGATTETLKSGRDAPLAGIQTVVLVDGASASASEIVAGALKDHGAATLVGEKTYGKGSVQSIQSVGNQGDQLKVTIAKWYTPNGKNIDKEGISPDVTVSVSAEDITAGRDPQKDAALQRLR